MKNVSPLLRPTFYNRTLSTNYGTSSLTLLHRSFLNRHSFKNHHIRLGAAYIHDSSNVCSIRTNDRPNYPINDKNKDIRIQALYLDHVWNKVEHTHTDLSQVEPVTKFELYQTILNEEFKAKVDLINPRKTLRINPLYKTLKLTDFTFHIKIQIDYC